MNIFSRSSKWVLFWSSRIGNMALNPIENPLNPFGPTLSGLLMIVASILTLISALLFLPVGITAIILNYLHKSNE